MNDQNERNVRRAMLSNLVAPRVARECRRPAATDGGLWGGPGTAHSPSQECLPWFEKLDNKGPVARRDAVQAREKRIGTRDQIPTGSTRP
jgi:hypothetical protein